MREAVRAGVAQTWGQHVPDLVVLQDGLPRRWFRVLIDAMIWQFLGRPAADQWPQLLAALPLRGIVRRRIHQSRLEDGTRKSPHCSMFPHLSFRFHNSPGSLACPDKGLAIPGQPPDPQVLFSSSS